MTRREHDIILEGINSLFAEAHSPRKSAILAGQQKFKDQGLDVVAGDEELGFSHRPCAMCGDTHAGDRHSLGLLRAKKGGGMEHVDTIAACPDCLSHVANGEMKESTEYNVAYDARRKKVLGLQYLPEQTVTFELPFTKSGYERIVESVVAKHGKNARSGKMLHDAFFEHSKTVVTEGKIDPVYAKEVLSKLSHDNFFALRHSEISDLLDIAKKYKYKKRKDAPGSTARMFHQHLQRLANRVDKK